MYRAEDWAVSTRVTRHRERERRKVSQDLQSCVYPEDNKLLSTDKKTPK